MASGTGVGVTVADSLTKRLSDPWAAVAPAAGAVAVSADSTAALRGAWGQLEPRVRRAAVVRALLARAQREAAGPAGAAGAAAPSASGRSYEGEFDALLALAGEDDDEWVRVLGAASAKCGADAPADGDGRGRDLDLSRVPAGIGGVEEAVTRLLAALGEDGAAEAIGGALESVGRDAAGADATPWFTSRSGEFEPEQLAAVGEKRGAHAAGL
eukprot:PRCOL_00003964-RA